MSPSSVPSIKNQFFEIFKSDSFITAYHALSKQVALARYGTTSGIGVQPTPMPRIFLPGSHGTSFHTDYWYGHGLEACTVWVPIFNCFSGSTFFSDHSNNLGIDTVHDKSIDPLSPSFISRLQSSEFEIIPPDSSCYIFSSSVLHGSTYNRTSFPRLSFDFRIAPLNDPSSNKDLSQYLLFDESSNSFALPIHPLSQKSVLKYIVGGPDTNAQLQLMLIEQVARQNSIYAVDQEREIERFDYPVLRRIIEDDSFLSKYDAIALMSKAMIPSSLLSALAKSKKRFWFAFENAIV